MVIFSAVFGLSRGAKQLLECVRSSWLLAGAIVACVVGTPLTALAAVPSYVVTTAGDTTNGSPGNCTNQHSMGAMPDASCSLRDALAASANGGGAISFNATVFGATQPASARTITLGSGGTLTLPSNTSVTGLTTGSGSTLTNLVTVSGNQQSTVLTVASGVTSASVSYMTFTKGSAPYLGGADISNDGALKLIGVLITGVQDDLNLSSALLNSSDGVLTILDSTLADNYQLSDLPGGPDGGGIANFGTLDVVSTLVTNNYGYEGGGIFNGATGMLTVADSTVVDNFTNNYTFPAGSGLYNNGGTMVVSNSIVSDNTSTTGDPGSQPYEDDCGGSGCPANGIAGNLAGAGLSSTLPGSAAICAGLVSSIPAGDTMDLRALPRTTMYGSTSCVDAGAVQTHYTLSFASQPPADVATGTSFPASVQLSESGSPLRVSGITISVALSPGDSGTLTGGSAATNTSGMATFGQLAVSAPGAGDMLEAFLPVTTTPPPAPLPAPISISISSRPFNVGTVTPPTPAVPAFNPPGGTYTGAQSVQIFDTTAGASIHYTTDGSMPSVNSTLYTTPIQVAITETIKAIAILNGVSSTVASASYTIYAAQCTIIDYSHGFTGSGLSLNGGASVADGLLKLTDGGAYESRSAFTSQMVPVADYETDFTFQLINPFADGITFTIQSDKPQDVGQAGVGLGYAGIPRSVALKFDLYNNSGEGLDSTGIYIDGALPTTPAIDLSSTGIHLHSGHVFEVHILDTNGIATASITDTVTSQSASATMPGNLVGIVGSNAYIGFTAGTGGLTAMQNILTWSFKGGSGCSF